MNVVSVLNDSCSCNILAMAYRGVTVFKRILIGERRPTVPPYYDDLLILAYVDSKTAINSARVMDCRYHYSQRGKGKDYSFAAVIASASSHFSIFVWFPVLIQDRGDGQQGVQMESRHASSATSAAVPIALGD